MPTVLSKAQLIERINHLRSGQWQEDEAETLFREISESVPCPSTDIQGYIFHSADDLDAEAIAERMLSYKAVQL